MMPPRVARRPLAVALTIGALTALHAAPSAAWVLAEDEMEETSTALGVVIRSFAFLLAGDTLAPPYSPTDVSPTAVGIFDARTYFEHRTPKVKVVVHHQLTLNMRSHTLLGGGLGVGRGLSPPRWLPLTFQDRDDPTLTLRSDTDWVFVSATFGMATVTVGRQPVSFGRGTLWRTTDRISTFSLTEVDRSYKPGADALRVDVAPDDKTQLTLVAALGELESKEHDFDVALNGSSFLGHFKRAWHGGELGVTAGFVRNDALFGIDGVFDFGAFDLYAEVALTRTTKNSLATPAADDQAIPIPSVVLGATLRPHPKLMLKPEAHFNGFGSWKAVDYLSVATSPRVGIGEQVGLGKVYLGVSTDFEAHPLTHVFTAMLTNATDPSALLTVGVNHSLASNVEVSAGGYIPMGPLPDTSQFAARSEYGSYPVFLFTELKGTL